MNAAEIFGLFGIFVIIWWIGRRVGDALDRYELMKEQRNNDGNGRRNAVGRPRNADVLRAPARPRQSALR
jgi:hypothetical protein